MTRWTRGTFFNNLSGTEKNPLRQNQFGFVAGGPAIKNRTFWLANYEGRRTRNAALGFLNVPTQDQLDGIFTGYQGPNRAANPLPVLDPLSGPVGAPTMPFPDNRVPKSRNSRLANLAIAKFIPAPQLRFRPWQLSPAAFSPDGCGSIHDPRGSESGQMG